MISKKSVVYLWIKASLGSYNKTNPTNIIIIKVLCWCVRACLSFHHAKIIALLNSNFKHSSHLTRTMNCNDYVIPFVARMDRKKKSFLLNGRVTLFFDNLTNLYTLYHDRGIKEIIKRFTSEFLPTVKGSLHFQRNVVQNRKTLSFLRRN